MLDIVLCWTSSCAGHRPVLTSSSILDIVLCWTSSCAGHRPDRPKQAKLPQTTRNILARNPPIFETRGKQGRGVRIQTKERSLLARITNNLENTNKIRPRISEATPSWLNIPATTGTKTLTYWTSSCTGNDDGHNNAVMSNYQKPRSQPLNLQLIVLMWTCEIFSPVARLSVADTR